jgi:hypothetical protein
MEKIRIRDGKNSDPQHWTEEFEENGRGAKIMSGKTLRASQSSFTTETQPSVHGATSEG